MNNTQTTTITPIVSGLKSRAIAKTRARMTIRKTSSSSSQIEVKAEELSKLDIGSWFGEEWKEETIPLLSEVLDLIPKRKEIYIEVKTGTEITDQLIKDIYQHKEKIKEMSIISFYPEVIKEIKSIAPELTANLLVNFEGHKLIEENDIVRMMKEINADGIGAQNHKSLDIHFFNKINRENKKVHVWTVNSKEEAKRYYELGLDSVTTNCPGKIREYLSNSI